MGFVTNEQVAAIGILGESFDVCAEALVAANEYVEYLGLGEGFEALFNVLSVGFGEREYFDRVGTKPLDKLVVPVLDETAGANDNDALGRGRSIVRDARLEQCVNERERLQRLACSSCCIVCE